jgi:BirA family biotin operon repressor/biotin-[acetyl-CoA-carboxylase] ligase
MFDTVEVLTSVDSTNDFIKRYTSEGVPRLVVASCQTQGKGRFGRRWSSPAGEGLYVSYLFFPDWDSSRVSMLNAVVSLAALRAVKTVGKGRLQVRLKAPNDLYVGPRKLGGILVESSIAGNRIQWVVAGVGVNVLQGGFPGELEGRATSLRLEAVDDCGPMDLCSELTGCLEHYIKAAETGDWPGLLQEYEKAEQ